MKIKTLFRFLGSLTFALILIALAACFVILGTFLEASTDSHRYAALFTYNSRLFETLLWGFFLNILISALRRYPFKFHHIPFLITHFGMLMILAGTLIKSYFGVQGNMIIWEGSASNQLYLPESYSLLLDARNSKAPEFYRLNKKFISYTSIEPEISSSKNHSELKITLMGYKPNSYEKLESWVKSGHLSIFGLKPFPLSSYPSIEQALPEAIKVKLMNSNELFWNLIALKTDIEAEIIIKKTLELYSSIPTLVIMQNKQEDIKLIILTKDGQTAIFNSPQGDLKRVLAYDDGFLGYTTEATFPQLENPPLLESPLKAKHYVIPPSKKLEANLPCIIVRFSKDSIQDTVTLTYSPLGNGFKWPVLNGEFVARFQPHIQKIPYKLRLRQARQINYPGSQQPFSYECDLIITNNSTNEQIESSLSMNQVYETWDGYRFYLSNISPPTKGALKQVQITVNRDPAKYWLTYPGIFCMSLGILLLFFLPKKKPI